MKRQNIVYIAAAVTLLTSGCATQNISDTAAPAKQVTKAAATKTEQKAKKPSARHFTAAEIKDIRSAFKPGSCDLTAINAQSAKYGLSPTWVNLYERTPQPLSELSDAEACFLAQSDEMFAYTDEFYGESSSSFGNTWFKNSISADAKVVNMRFLTPEALIEKCDPELGRPIIVDYEKDEQGKMMRTIFVNEDFDMDCI